MKAVSIVIPVYNAAEWLRPSVESLFRQGLAEQDFEVVLVNDGSKDGSLALCKQLAEEHANIVVIDKENGGVSSARNAGINAATGEYLCLMDNDDEFVPGSLALMAEEIRKHDVDVLTARRLDIPNREMEAAAERYRKENEAGYKDVVLPMDEYISRHTDMRRYELFQLWRTNFLRENNIHFPEQLHLAEDVLFTISGLLATDKVVMTDIAFYLYRTNDQSVIHNVKMRNILSLIDAIPMLIKLWPKAKGCLPKVKEVTYHQMAIALFYVTHTPELWMQRGTVARHYRQIVPWTILGRTFAQKAASLIMRLSPLTYMNLRHR